METECAFVAADLCHNPSKAILTQHWWVQWVFPPLTTAGVRVRHKIFVNKTGTMNNLSGNSGIFHWTFNATHVYEYGKMFLCYSPCPSCLSVSKLDDWESGLGCWGLSNDNLLQLLVRGRTNHNYQVWLASNVATEPTSMASLSMHATFCANGQWATFCYVPRLSRCVNLLDIHDSR